jgi:hypothetical protein
MLAEMKVDLDSFSLPRQPKAPNLTDADQKKLAAMDMKSALAEYNQRVKLSPDDPKSVKYFAEVLDEQMEAVAPGCMAKLAEARLDAYQGQLWVRKLLVRGENASLISSMFTTTDRALYPEYVRRVMTEAPMTGLGYALIDDLIAGRETISGFVGQGVVITSATGPKMKKIAEGAGFPKTKIDMSTVTVAVHKHGHEFDLTREVERRVSMNVLGIILCRGGVQFQKDMAVLGANTALDGATDGGETGTSGKITMKEFVKQRRKHAHQGYRANVILYGETVDDAICENPEVWDPLTSKIALTGELPNLAGARNLFISEDSQLTTSKLLYIDTTINQLMVVEAGSELAESDYFAQNQIFAYTYSICFSLWVLIAAAARKYAIKA